MVDFCLCGKADSSSSSSSLCLSLSLLVLLVLLRTSLLLLLLLLLLSLSLSLCFSLFVSVCMSLCLCLSVYVSVCLSVCLPTLLLFRPTACCCLTSTLPACSPTRWLSKTIVRMLLPLLPAPSYPRNGCRSSVAFWPMLLPVRLWLFPRDDCLSCFGSAVVVPVQ